MAQDTGNTRISLTPAAIILGLVLLVCTIIVSGTFVKVKGFGQTIAVTGAAYKPIMSDYAIWEAGITTTQPTMEAAHRKLSRDIKTVEAFVIAEGFDSSQYDIGSMNVYRQYNRDSEVIGFTVRQSVKVESDNVAQIKQLARSSSQLVEKGVELESSRPRYLFTGLDALKIEMIKAATENAKLRAEQLAATTGRSVGAPTSARVGVFQIRPLHSQEVSGMGMSDDSSVEKEIVSTVHVSFLID